MSWAPSHAKAGPQAVESTVAAEERAKIEAWTADALEGDAAAEYNLALVYLEGSGLPTKATVTKDNARAVSLMSQAAAQNFEPAMYYLGIIYAAGTFGVEEDLTQSYCWFERTAKRAYPRGYFALGKMYLEGMGREVDLVKAHAFLTVSTAMGHGPSKGLLEKVLGGLSKEGPDLGFVEKSMAFFNEWSDLPEPECDLPAPAADR